MESGLPLYLGGVSFLIETVAIFANGKKVVKGKLPRTFCNQFLLIAGVDIGTVPGTAVDFTYTLSFTCTGKTEKVTINLK